MPQKAEKPADQPPRTAGAGEAAASLPLVVVPRQPASEPRRSAIGRLLRRIRFLPLIPLLMMTGAVVGLYFQPPGVRFVMGWLGLAPGGGTSTPIAVPAPPAPKPGESPTRAPRFVAGLGKLLPEGEVITIAPPFGAGDARLAILKVGEGERVEKGQVLAVLDNERQFSAALETARAQLAAREAVAGQVRSAIEASRAEARASLARAEATAANAAREFDRVEELRRRGFAADQNYELRRTQREEAAREVERLRANLSRYGEDIDRQPDVLVAARNLDSAKADVERATADLDKAYVRAPQAATVLSISVRPGEKPGQQGIMNLGDLDHMKAEVEIYQSLIGRVVLGAEVEITAEALPRRLSGKVSRIGLEVGRQTLLDANPAANTDARVVKVHVALDAASSEVARRFTNLQVTARIAIPEQP